MNIVLLAFTFTISLMLINYVIASLIESIEMNKEVNAIKHFENSLVATYYLIRIHLNFRYKYKLLRMGGSNLLESLILSLLSPFDINKSKVVVIVLTRFIVRKSPITLNIITEAYVHLLKEK